MVSLHRDLNQLLANAAGGYAQPEPPAWMVDALCAETDPELFFPEKGGSTLPAKALCGRCSVRSECLDYALSYETGEMGAATSYPSGVYGGMSERERRPLRAERRAKRQGVA